ncbi:MAG TPA: nuclear transport factor 2 family protein [Gaiellaceae bacterium]|nr:nuclear transport factor 2 family protein [Gaiellaceae bacterium]
MDDAAVSRWLSSYVDAWQTYDAAAIGALFSEEAVYRYHSWDENEDVIRGRAAIVSNWLEDQDPPDSWIAEYHPWAVTGERAVAVGATRYLTDDPEAVDREYRNVFLLEFDADDRCKSFTELYMPRSGSS